MNFDIDSIKVLNPKLRTPKNSTKSNSALFSYYAGFSENFTIDMLNQLTSPTQKSTIFDPWNGSGTTTFSAYKLGHNAIGNDLNPIMLIIAKARLINHLDLGSLEAICKTIFYNASKKSNNKFLYESDPLGIWFSEDSCKFLRKLEICINKNFINFESYSLLTESASQNTLSTIGAFLYVILFKTAKTLLKKFIPSNPTWIKKPKHSEDKLNISNADIRVCFFNILDETLKNHIFNDVNKQDTLFDLQLANSINLSQKSNSVDIILTSPPYCTRIDYAIATSIELAVIQVTNIRTLRENLIGTSTIRKQIVTSKEQWGETCNTFLNNVENHSSVASSSYYLKNHLQYFDDLYQSLENISKVLKLNGLFIPVVQNSFYKEINNDLAEVIVEMSANFGMSLIRHDKFESKINMSSINSRSNKYIVGKKIAESVLIFKKMESNHA